MPHDFDVICVGNAKIDTFLTLRETNSHLRFLKETNELCIKFGEKITVDKAELLLGGNAANVSVGLSRLGLNSALIAEIGDDEFAQKIVNTLSKENVDATQVLQTKGQQSSFSTIINFKKERTIFSEHVKRDHNFTFENIAAKWVYLTSLGEEWRKAYSNTCDFVKKTKSRLAFNPGTIQINGGLENIQNVLSLSDILFVNKEEAEKIMNYELRIMNQEENEEKIKLLLEQLQKLGPKTVVITDGENGSYCLDENGNFYEHGVSPADVIEKTGAGDAYSSGFLSAILYNQSVQQAMEQGARNSSSVISKIGAQEGLLRKEEIQERLKS